jgi:hypothetical protein
MCFVESDAAENDIVENRTAAHRNRDAFAAILGANHGDGFEDEAITYLTGRGLKAHTIKHFALGHDASAPSFGRLSIPIFDETGLLVSVVARALYDRYPCQVCGEEVAAKAIARARVLKSTASDSGEPGLDWNACPHCNADGARAGLRFLAEQTPTYRYQKEFDKESLLYHQHGARTALEDEACTGLFLVEGYSDAWAIWQAREHAVCAYMGAKLSLRQAQQATALAVEFGKPIILVPDNDHTGATSTGSNIARLRACASDVTVLVASVDGLEPPCLDIAGVLKSHGDSKVASLLASAVAAGISPTALYCVNEIAEAAMTAEASDIHLRKNSEPYFRCGGSLLASGFAPYLTEGALAELRNRVDEPGANVHILAEIRAPSGAHGARWRVAVFAENAVLRRIPETIPALPSSSRQSS